MVDFFVSHSRWSISLFHIQDGRFLVSQVPPINVKIKTIKAKLWEMSNSKSVGPIIQSSQSRVGVKICNPFLPAVGSCAQMLAQSHFTAFN
jgi:hypothetical protein